MRLAWSCSEPHADFILDRLTPEQVADVEAFAATEPLPDARADLRAAMVALVTARSAGVKGVKLADFLLDTRPKTAAEEQDQDEMNRQMMKLAGLCEGAERRRARNKPPADAEECRRDTGVLDP